MSVALRTCRPDEVFALLPEALAGRFAIAPVADAASAALYAGVDRVDVPGAAVVVATSGSTGTPKAVILTTDALLASARATQERLGGPATWHLALPAHYVAGLMVLVRARVSGLEPRFAASDLADLAPASGRNVVSIVPTQLVRALDDPFVTASLASMDAVLLGGAAADPVLLSRARDAGVNVVTTYGMSETCGGCVYDGVPLDGVVVSVGHGGRVWLGGASVFSGYLARPDLTASTLVPDPTGKHAGLGVLTHDRGRLDGGHLTVLGRTDEVVISGGTNVDLAEVQRAVDAIVTAHGLGASAVVGVPDAEWGAVVTLASESPTRDLTWWRDHLPLGRPALPRRAVGVGRLPRTSSGKIDRTELARYLGSLHGDVV